MPTTGIRKIFALLIDFQDTPHCIDERAIQQALFGKGRDGAPYDSVAAYYDRSSYSQLDLYGGTALSWYTAPYPRASVERTDAGRECLIKEALEHFRSRGINYRQYDTNGDGTVDFFLVIWAGKDTGWGTFWWPYQTSFTDTGFSLDGIKFGKYAWMWESEAVGGSFDTSTVIHELGHALGLPDYYDYNKCKGPRGGVGGLDMMDSTQHDHNCFSKWLLDWVAPSVLTEGAETMSLGPSGSYKDCVIIWPQVRPDVRFGECFMVQNRQRLANDLGLPGEGLLIWHVDATLNGDDFAYDNSFTEHKLLRLMEADGREQIEAGGLADAADFYKPGASFGYQTKPSSSGYGGHWTGVEVRQILSRRNQMTATFAAARRRGSLQV